MTPPQFSSGGVIVFIVCNPDNPYPPEKQVVNLIGP